MAYNPSSINIQRQLGATRPLPRVRLPSPTTSPNIGSSLNLHRMMRPQNRARGGEITDSPESPFTGGIMSAGAGRADDVQMHVPDGAYVMPAWAVSHMGEGNTINGMAMLKMMFGSPWQGQKTPFGAPSPALKTGKGIGIPKAPKMMTSQPWIVPGMSQKNPALQAHGGAATDLPTRNGAVPINASGGEFVVEPDEVAKIGDGNIDKGHRLLDMWLLKLKKEAADTIKRLPGPAK